MSLSITWFMTMSLGARIIQLRKHAGWTQQALADAVAIHVNQIKRYEAGSAQPSVEALKRLARAFAVSSDALLFEDGERAPSDDLKLQFEAVSRFDDEEKQVIRSLLDGMIIKHQARRWDSARAALAAPAPTKKPAAGAKRHARVGAQRA